MISVGIQEVFLHLKEMKTNNPHANVSQVQTHEQTQLSYVYNPTGAWSRHPLVHVHLKFVP